eukprot:45037_1
MMNESSPNKFETDLESQQIITPNTYKRKTKIPMKTCLLSSILLFLFIAIYSILNDTTHSLRLLLSIKGQSTPIITPLSNEPLTPLQPDILVPLTPTRKDPEHDDDETCKKLIQTIAFIIQFKTGSNTTKEYESLSHIDKIEQGLGLSRQETKQGVRSSLVTKQGVQQGVHSFLVPISFNTTSIHVESNSIQENNSPWEECLPMIQRGMDEINRKKVKYQSLAVKLDIVSKEQEHVTAVLYLQYWITQNIPMISETKKKEISKTYFKPKYYDVYPIRNHYRFETDRQIKEWIPMVYYFQQRMKGKDDKDEIAKRFGFQIDPRGDGHTYCYSNATVQHVDERLFASIQFIADRNLVRHGARTIRKFIWYKDGEVVYYLRCSDIDERKPCFARGLTTRGFANHDWQPES